jgi:hypothetical protein
MILLNGGNSLTTTASSVERKYFRRPSHNNRQLGSDRFHQHRQPAAFGHGPLVIRKGLPRILGPSHGRD